MRLKINILIGIFMLLTVSVFSQIRLTQLERADTLMQVPVTNGALFSQRYESLATLIIDSLGIDPNKVDSIFVRNDTIFLRDGTGFVDVSGFGGDTSKWALNGTHIYNKNSGNVGIGIDNPLQKLDIRNGNIRTEQTTAGNISGVIYKDGNRFIHDFNYGNNGTVTTLGENTFVGVNAGNLTMGSTATINFQSSQNVAIGNQSFFSNTTGNKNVATGFQSLYSNTTGTQNMAIGFQSLRSNTTGYQNVAIGNLSLFSNTTGRANMAIGDEALFSNTTGFLNAAIGSQSLYSNTTAFYNIGVGARTLFSNSTSFHNVAIGYESLFSKTSGSNDTGVGHQALYSQINGFHNTAIGSLSLRSNISGGKNTASGYESGRYIANGVTGRTTGNNGVYLGAESRASANGTTNEIVIGYLATGIGSNTVVLGNDNIVTTALKGSVGIGTTAPHASSKVDITSTTQGLLPPRMTTAQRNAISSPVAGLQVYNTTDGVMQHYTGVIWQNEFGGTDSIYVQNDTIFLRDGTGFVSISALIQTYDSIYLVGDTIRLRDGTGYVLVPDITQDATMIEAGAGILITGSGTTMNPYIINENYWHYEADSVFSNIRHGKILLDSVALAPFYYRSDSVLTSQKYVIGQYDNYVNNGYGYSDDFGFITNYNFLDFELDTTDHDKAFASFKYLGTYDTLFTQEQIPIDDSNKYKFSISVKGNGTDSVWVGVVNYDRDSRVIHHKHVTYKDSTETMTAQAINTSATTIEATDLTGWDNTGLVAIYDEVSAAGFVYPDYTYTRKVLEYTNITGNIITLATAYTGASVDPNTKIAQALDGDLYIYAAKDTIFNNTEWHRVDTTFTPRLYTMYAKPVFQLSDAMKVSSVRLFNASGDEQIFQQLTISPTRDSIFLSDGGHVVIDTFIPETITDINYYVDGVDTMGIWYLNEALDTIVMLYGPEDCITYMTTGKWDVNGTHIYNNNSGNVGINTTAPSEKLDVDGSARFRIVGSVGMSAALNLTPTGVLTTDVSDIRMKENIFPLYNNIDKVMQMKPVSFTWKDTEDSESVGFIAQDMQLVVPEVVFLNQNSGMYGINYNYLTSIIAGAVQEQQKVIKKQTKIIQQQREELDDYNDKLNYLLIKVGEMDLEIKKLKEK